MFSGFVDPEFLGLLLVYGIMFFGAWICTKIFD